MNLNIKLAEGVTQEQFPGYATIGAAGFDLHAVSFKKLMKGDSKEVELEKLKYLLSKGEITMRPGERLLVGTGIHAEVPAGYELQIRPRSGITLKRGLTVINTPGTIDEDYRGEIGVILLNTTNSIARVKIGEAIAQGVLASYVKASFTVVEELSSTERGEGGFGSTDKGSQVERVAVRDTP